MGTTGCCPCLPFTELTSSQAKAPNICVSRIETASLASCLSGCSTTCKLLMHGRVALSGPDCPSPQSDGPPVLTNQGPGL